MQQRDNQKVIATRTGDPVHHDEYKRLRNLVKTKLPNDKNSFYSNILKDDNQTIPGMWATAYRALGYTKNLSPVQLVVDGKAVLAPREMANAFNNVFLKKVKDLKDGIVGPIIEEPLTRLVRWIGQRQEHIPEFTLHSITILTLRKIIKNLKGKKSSGIDMIDGYSVKLASPLIEDTLLHLVNLSIEESHYPKYWKVSKIAPLYKKDDRTNGENYRPVSNIIFVSQICEKAVFDQVFCHFQSHHLFHPNNHGFRPCHSTVSALIQLQDLWLLAAERHEISASLLLDLSAAFDLVEHEILLGKLGIYGFSPSSLNWFASYLKDRIQYVQVESRLSDPQPTGSQGVPQGSLLGPLLFLIFYNDFPETKYPLEHLTREYENKSLPLTELPTCSTSVLYADDNTDNSSDKDPDVLQRKIQFEADCSTAWVSDNKLVCSGGKTKLLIVSTTAMRLSRLQIMTRGRLVNKQIQIQVCGKTVKESNCEKILGVLGNNKLTWHHHLFGDFSDPKNPMTGLVSQLAKRVGMLSRLVKLVPANRFKLLVNGLFMSKLLYCLPLFANALGLPTSRIIDTETRYHSFTKSNLKTLQTLENKVLRLITGRGYRTPVIQLLEESQMLSVNQLVVFSTIMIVFKVQHTGEPKYLDNRLKMNYGGRINIHFNLSRAREGFMYRASKCFSSLPPDIKSETKEGLFKSKVRLWIKSTIPAIPT